MKFKKLFMFRISFLVFVQNSFLLLLLIERVLCVDPRFGTCKPQICGNQNISYPFWINDTKILPDYCGYPGFEISCKSDKPMLKISGNDYMIQEINNQTQSVRVTYQGAAEDYCPSPLYNVSLDRTPFGFDYDHAYLFIFFNCSSLLDDAYSRYRINCTPHDYTFSPLTLFEGDPELNSSYLFQECDKSVLAPVEKEIGDGIFPGKMYQEILNKGFLLRWNAANCSDCLESGGQCGFDWKAYKFNCLCRDRPHMKSCLEDKKRWVKVALGISSGVIAGAFLVICIVLCRKKLKFGLVKRKDISTPSTTVSSNPSSRTKDLEKGSIFMGVSIPIFTYEVLEEATNNFDASKELGDGGFGTVYHGKLRDGRDVAVKRLYENNYRRVEQFMNEIEILTRLRHKNLVTLYGCTSRRSRELILVYEYIPNGTVADHLHGDRAKAGGLPWSIRMSIALETAGALTYLHASDIIHRDVKTNNILLDNNFSVKVADFGLSRLFPTDATHVSTAPQGTPGYVDPEYHQCYQLTGKSDVYSFGVVLIELISSKPAVDISRHRHEINLATMAMNKIQNRALHELVDPDLNFESDSAVRRMVTGMAELAFRCLQYDREMRPTMDEALEILNAIGNEDYNVTKTEEVDTQSDQVGLLKNNKRPPTSPVTVTYPWSSEKTTPNTSS
ncbi:PREDICTED: LEAF RUST 10 DISEASE-RESISTANCE LOCUS RECEPTOR-LIKE PROTEIN KINASE-like 1.2 isoform X3 [Nelumbo nucifera]|uniref:non-specific serine/threonine protein kinase n=2 Tax=Nelumbo nucifera TaxID=4432 RepID=A0A1U8BD46_NELNU|nr:PREDICTED: LEAF RUST 10 DISEASE-RESISTANCE LOCUS RECEPTOR-LIKE PROTEIN KINASE-like 1.2 isoform X3 [Nelumbo nucifera]DAD31858.1 TPA_asm: hypothetical protein HUJ06_010709 [Nelumbo nucifera]